MPPGPEEELISSLVDTPSWNISNLAPLIGNGLDSAGLDDLASPLARFSSDGKMMAELLNAPLYVFTLRLSVLSTRSCRPAPSTCQVAVHWLPWAGTQQSHALQVLCPGTGTAAGPARGPAGSQSGRRCCCRGEPPAAIKHQAQVKQASLHSPTAMQRQPGPQTLMMACSILNVVG